MALWENDPDRWIKAAEFSYRKWLESPLIQRWLQMEGSAAEARLVTAIARLRSSSLLIGAADLALTAGVPLSVWVGVWVALGAPYAQAAALVRNENFQSGFSQGFVMGLLKWDWQHAVSRFGQFAPQVNVVESSLGYIAANAHNEGLRTGFSHAMLLPDNARKAVLDKLKGMAPSTRAGQWTRNDQISYVIDLASAGRRNSFFK